MRLNFLLLTLLLLAPLSSLAQETVTEGKKLTHDIFVMDASGDNALRLTDGTSIVQEPSWSPNGQLIAFSRGTTQGLDIWVMSPDGRGSHAVTDLAGDEISPSWSGDGSTIAFCSFADRPASASIQAVSLSGGDPISLTDTSPLTEPAFSPSGDKLLVTKFLDSQPRKYNFRISILENGTFTDIETSEGSSFLTQGSWSRNGNFIVCRANKIGLGDIGVFTLSDLSYIQLTSHPSEDRDPAFSPDGRKIVFASDRTGDFDLYTINVDGTGLQALTQTPDQDELEPAFSPDGQKIAYTAIRLATTDEEDTAFKADIGLPASLQTGLFLPDSKTARLSPWRLGSVWRTSHQALFILLGENGELIGTDLNAAHPQVEVLYYVREGLDVFLFHSGPLWRGYYARILPDGSVVREHPQQRPGAPSPPSAEYDLWPFRDESDRIDTVTTDEAFFPKVSSTRYTLTTPSDSIAWLIRLASGELYLPIQETSPPENVIWVVRKDDGFELVYSGPRYNGTYATVSPNRSIQIVGDPRTDLYWPFEYLSGELAIPPPGFTIQKFHSDPRPITVYPNGRVSMPGFEVRG